MRDSKRSDANIVFSFSTSAIGELEDFIEKAKINGSDLVMTSDNVVALQYEPTDTFNGFDLYVNDNEVLKNIRFHIN